jgi:predicted peptidase
MRRKDLGVAITPFWQASGQSPQTLLVYLHGRGEIGGDPDRRVHTYGPWLNASYNPRNAYGPEARSEIRRFHVLGLHLSEGDWEGAALDAAVEAHLAAHPGIDRTRLLLTGLSLGGRGVLRLALHRLRRGQPVTAVASFCPAGGADAYSDEDIALLRTVPVYLFHSPEDNVVPFEASTRLHERLGTRTSRLRIVHVSELARADAPHDCWTQFYGTAPLYQWLAAPDGDPALWPYMDVPVAA